jgi:predicted Fe-Mo cluster-binding NifX family protein
MQIAIATNDGVAVSSHLARCTAVTVLTIADGVIASTAVRPRSSDTCGNHGSFVDLLSGCQAVICGGIGAGAANALAARGIEALVLARPMSISAAAEAYLAGTLATTNDRVCLCG